MVRPNRFERLTCPTYVGPLYPAECLKKKLSFESHFYGAAKSIRTIDLFLRREALYPAELWPHMDNLILNDLFNDFSTLKLLKLVFNLSSFRWCWVALKKYEFKRP